MGGNAVVAVPSRSRDPLDALSDVRGVEDSATSAMLRKASPRSRRCPVLPRLPDHFRCFVEIMIGARPLGTFVVADCWLAAENLMLAACVMGLGTYCIGFAVPVLNRAEVKAELGIPPDVVAVASIIVGVPREQGRQTPRKAPEIICWRKETDR